MRKQKTFDPVFGHGSGDLRSTWAEPSDQGEMRWNQRKPTMEEQELKAYRIEKAYVIKRNQSLKKGEI